MSHCRVAFFLLCSFLAALPFAGARAPVPGKQSDNLNGLKSRGPSVRQKLLRDGGGNAASEKAVADGLRWLALHQADDGHWGLNDFHKHARQKPWPAGKTETDDSTPGYDRGNDVAGTAMALLPFLAAGVTHKATPGAADNPYRKTVWAGLDWLTRQQSKEAKNRGGFGRDLYTQALATIALCEAYHMTDDPKLKGLARSALDYLVAAQHDEGGWRYIPKQAGDLSVTGFVLRALTVGKAAGLDVPKGVEKKVAKFLDSCESAKGGGYSYTPGNDAAKAMTAVGALCRQLLGVNPRNPSLSASVKKIKESALGTAGTYHDYYATRVMFNLGGEDWKLWNLGPEGKGGIRDTLIAKQDDGRNRKGNKGSWQGDTSVGGRLGATSLSLLTLQVYYRYPALYKRD